MFGNLKDINDKGVIIMKNNFDTNELSVLTAAYNILKKHKKNAIDAPSTLDINKLAQDLLEEIIKGNGDKKIFISSDDEGNSFHRLFYTIDTSPEYLDEIRADNPCMEDFNNEQIALLG